MASSEEILLDLIKTGDESTVQSPVWFNAITAAINDLLVNDFGRLVQVLYSADVSEDKLKKTLLSTAGQDSAPVIAEMLLNRQLQKIRSRLAFRQVLGSVPDDEAW